AGVAFNKGTTAVNWTVTDTSSHTASCQFNVVVTDNQNPTISCVSSPQNRNRSEERRAETARSMEFNPTAFADNCPGATISYTVTGATSCTGTTLAGVAFNKGTTTVSWTVTDTSSHTATCSFTVTVSDNQNPTISCVSSPQNRN